MAENGGVALRQAIADGAATVEVIPLRPDDIDLITWSGGRPHLEDIARQLQRVAAGEVEYLYVRVDGRAVSKGGVDFTKEPGAATIWQLATHGDFEGLGLATRLIQELEARAVERGVRRVRLAVEPENHRARRLYEHLGFQAIGESQASWEAEAADGRRFLYTTRLIEMLKVLPPASA